MQDFKKFLKIELNSPQRKAVIQKKGSLLVVAGAGSGKTRVITARITNLILNNEVDPRSIIALTFTNKAAGEMKDRIIHFLGTSSGLPFVGTFHAYCLLLLRTNKSILPFSDFSIMDEDDKRALIKKILKKNNLTKQFSTYQVSHKISNTKNQISSEDVSSNNEIFQNPLLKDLYMAYETEKASSHCLDFDDLLITVLKIFQQNKDFKKQFQQKIKHILVDEYQDTNGVQHELLKEMALGGKKKFVIDSMCGVGDQDQSIYSWRGAKVTNMLLFQQDFAPTKVIKIEQNYRSVQPILSAANSVIKNNTQRHPKKLWSEKKATNRILCLDCQSGYQEANTISAYLNTTKTKLSNIAILYRTHFQSRQIEEALIRSSIPYVIIGGTRFYERKEIKDMLAYMRLMVNPFDRTSLFRIINCPAKGLGAKFEEMLYTEWNKNPLFDFKQILKHIKVKGNKSQAVKDFLQIFKIKDTKPSVILSKIIEQTQYLGYLRKTYDQRDSDAKIENVQELIQSISAYDKKKKAPLEEFLYEVALLQEKLETDNSDQEHVQMMTLHAAKGLEFNTVIITGLEEGLLPSAKSFGSDNDLEEERRLFYVGMTRAKERLILMYAKFRNTYGQINDQIPSRFVSEVPQKLALYTDLGQIHPAKIKTLIAQWLGTKFQTAVRTFSSNFEYKPIKLATSNRPKRTTIKWKKNQIVIHKKFGTGIIKKVEKDSPQKYYLTIFFKSGSKRILSSFVTATKN